MSLNFDMLLLLLLILLFFNLLSSESLSPFEKLSSRIIPLDILDIFKYLFLSKLDSSSSS